eukprot:1149164-Pelagomonas_calceolata.AAC.6
MAHCSLGGAGLGDVLCARITERITRPGKNAVRSGLMLCAYCLALDARFYSNGKGDARFCNNGK